jgi:hypothetical protein
MRVCIVILLLAQVPLLSMAMSQTNPLGKMPVITGIPRCEIKCNSTVMFGWACGFHRPLAMLICLPTGFFVNSRTSMRLYVVCAFQYVLTIFYASDFLSLHLYHSSFWRQGLRWQHKIPKVIFGTDTSWSSSRSFCRKSYLAGPTTSLCQADVMGRFLYWWFSFYIALIVPLFCVVKGLQHFSSSSTAGKGHGVTSIARVECMSRLICTGMNMSLMAGIIHCIYMGGNRLLGSSLPFQRTGFKSKLRAPKTSDATCSPITPA